MFTGKLKKVFDRAVEDFIEQIPATSLAFKERVRPESTYR